LLCLDIMMPGVDSYEVCRRVRASDRGADLTVRPRALLAERAEKTIELTPREVSMLRLLHDHRGEPVSRDAFLDACRGVDYFPDSRTLDQHIFLLRKKIEANPANPALIQSVRAVGYRYVPSGGKG
jgi:DNA-binding response OmpR family regulator